MMFQFFIVRTKMGVHLLQHNPDNYDTFWGFATYCKKLA